MIFRKAIFWMHLCIGVGVGLFVGFMAITGSILALEPQILRFSERNMVPAESVISASCKTPAQLFLTIQQQTARPVGVLEVSADRHMPVLVRLGKHDLLYADPCNGQLLQGSAINVRAFMVAVRNLHESASLQHERGGLLFNLKNAANLAFSFLIVSGLILWIPRQWRAANVRAVTLLRLPLKGRPWDWNLHNVFGLWFSIPLLAISITGVIMSYSWAEGLLYRASGSPLQVPHDESHTGGAHLDSTGGRQSSSVQAASTAAVASPEKAKKTEVRDTGQKAAEDSMSFERSSPAIDTRAKKASVQGSLSEESGQRSKDEIDAEKRSSSLTGAGQEEGQDSDRHPGVEHVRSRQQSDMKDESSAERKSGQYDGKETQIGNHTGIPNRSPQASGGTLAIAAVSDKDRSQHDSEEREGEHPGHVGKPGESESNEPGLGMRHEDNLVCALSVPDILGLDPLIRTAEEQVPGWRSFRLQISRSGQVVFFTFNAGDETEEEGKGRPAVLRIDRKNGTVLGWIPEEQLSKGAQWRRFARFLHTGQAYGLPGQIIALLASLSAVLLIWTGISLSVRRLLSWRVLVARKAAIARTSLSAASVMRAEP